MQFASVKVLHPSLAKLIVSVENEVRLVKLTPSYKQLNYALLHKKMIHNGGVNPEYILNILIIYSHHLCYAYCKF